ncbi:hypothetical protein FSP39_022312 [Pinctada imbricata]|uniref:Uncharacterized protein n=1 Tax=Pinctada imbricata TaxID=66713 RepID=A0AA88XWQ7_PINIB|nr:hypothetical protein FSP39_022312 [Pinctada imbricata]
MTVCNVKSSPCRYPSDLSIPDYSEDKSRIVTKSGNFNVRLNNVNSRILHNYLKDAFTTLVDAKWRWSILIFILGFMITWLFFALLYWLFSYLHGDTSDSYVEGIYGYPPCMSNVYDFSTAFLFSLETQHTIGYGSRATTTECPHVVILVFTQFIVGIGVQCLTAALVFSKLLRSKRRGGTVMFSQKACLGIVDGKWRLMIRVGDFRRSKLLGVKAICYLVKRSFTASREEYFEKVDVDFKSESGSEFLTLLWPAVIYHTIDQNSPLWPPERLQSFNEFSELIVNLEGVIESTSRVVQVRTSYIPTEVRYGYKFQNISPQVDVDGKYSCSYFDLNTMCPVLNTPGRKRRLNTSSF